MTELLNFSIPRIVVSGLRGGSGKTILSLCLVTLLKNKGFKVTTFKKGPDYIDAGWLAKASGTPCYNLDLFMMSPEQALQSFIFHSQNTQIAIIEGNRGLFDGVDHEGTYSTAELAKLLRSPVIITVDCTKATNTVAAMVLGCQKMDKELSIAGIVLNQVATVRQELLIRKAVEGRCSVPVVGAIPRLKKDPFPERHMGLTPFQEHKDIERSLSLVAEIGEKYLDVDRIIKISGGAEDFSEEAKKKGSRENASSPHHFITSTLKIGIIRDSAFQFYYQENFEELEKRGAELIEVSPLRENTLQDVDALYIGGGFPETHAVALAENADFRTSLYDAIQNGLPVYAECGGLMYLGKSLFLQNKEYPMVGIFPVVFGLEKRPQAHGYTIVETEKQNPYFPLKTVLRGHEFHYSHVLEFSGDNIHMAFSMKRGNGILDGKDGICYKNVLATYTHLHAVASPEWADGMISAASGSRKNRI